VVGGVSAAAKRRQAATVEVPGAKLRLRIDRARRSYTFRSSNHGRRSLVSKPTAEWYLRLWKAEGGRAAPKNAKTGLFSACLVELGP
jgi:hypothetical protein